MTDNTPGQVPEALDDLYLKLHGMSKRLESSGRIDESDAPEAYPAILDAMNLVRRLQSEAAQVPATPTQPAAPQGVAYAPSIEDLCARIKAADDAAADRDYMLDSNDCIAVLRGQWKGPMAMDKPDRASNGQAPATQQAGEVRPVTPYTCPKCHALWLHWPAEQTGFGRDTLNCRSADHCHYCEKAGVEQLQRLERIPAALHAPQPSPTAQAAPAPTHEQIAAYLEATGSYVTNDATREAAIADAVAAHEAQAAPAAGAVAGPQHELDGVIAECEHGLPFDATSLATLKRVRDSLAAAPTPAALADSVLEDAAPDIDAAFEAVRLGLCKIPRYSFALDSRGNLRRCEEKSGNWIEFDAAHALFDPVAVDAARKQGAKHD